MKEMKYITMALLCVLLASCMGKDYAEPVIEESPYGNNTLTETNVITIAELKDMYKTVISGSTMKQITDDIQIKGTITGNDIGGNIYQEVALEDETGALLVCISQAGLYGPLPVGQQILVSLKDLYIGGYGQQAEIGGVYTNTNTGKQSVGRMDRYTWNEHYKILGMGETPEPEVFDVSKISDATYLYENCGKLMTIKGVVLKDADGEKVYAPDDGSASITANCVNRAFSGLSSSRIVLRTSTYADFANAAMMTGTVDITGIFTRYNNIWQILMRDENDIQAGATALLKEPFDDDQGEFTIVNKTLPDELSFVWKWTSANYGMKGSAYYNSTNYAAESWLISPSVDMSGASSATLTFEQAANYGSTDNLGIYVSTSYNDEGTITESAWTRLTEDVKPEGSGWTFYTTTIDLSAYAGKSNVHIAFRYVSTADNAPTWEVKNVVIE